MFGNMSKNTRILVLLSSVFLSFVFFFPIWSIDLWAPQYPEGLGLKIWLSQITGDLNNINLLNHYIGMHAINPDDIPELKVFVYFFSGLTGLGILVAALGKRILLHSYALLFCIFSFGALYDFYQWEYKYGHELNPEAAIIMEGESYQPPLIGTKTLANIEASSYPAMGGYGHIIAFMLIAGSSGYEILRKRKA